MRRRTSQPATPAQSRLNPAKRCQPGSGGRTRTLRSRRSGRPCAARSSRRSFVGSVWVVGGGGGGGDGMTARPKAAQSNWLSSGRAHIQAAHNHRQQCTPGTAAKRPSRRERAANQTPSLTPGPPGRPAPPQTGQPPAGTARPGTGQQSPACMGGCMQRAAGVFWGRPQPPDGGCLQAMFDCCSQHAGRGAARGLGPRTQASGQLARLLDQPPAAGPREVAVAAAGVELAPVFMRLVLVGVSHARRGFRSRMLQISQVFLAKHQKSFPHPASLTASPHQGISKQVVAHDAHALPFGAAARVRRQALRAWGWGNRALARFASQSPPCGKPRARTLHTVQPAAWGGDHEKDCGRLRATSRPQNHMLTSGV